MTSDNLIALSAADLAAAVRERRVKARDVAEAFIDRMAAREAVTRAWIWRDDAGFRAAADRIDRDGPKGALCGVPLAIKDIIDTADMPTAYGSPIYAGNRPAWDAPAAAIARRQGALLPGKAVTTEFASSFAGPTTNPHDSGRTPGGSSSGSAAALADRTATLAFGTQTAGSVLRPASFCGVVGFKGSYGWFPTVGIKALSPCCDTLGLMARSVADVALFRDAMLMRPPAAAHSEAISAPRLGLSFYPFPERVSPAMRGAVEAAASRLSRAGARVFDITLPEALADLPAQHQTVMNYEGRFAFAWEADNRADRISAPFTKFLADGAATSLEQYRAALAAGGRARVAMANLWANCDALLLPAAAGEAIPIADGTGDPSFNRMASFLGLPAISLPNGVGAAGLPLGLQLVGRAGDDEGLLRLAAWVEASLI